MRHYLDWPQVGKHDINPRRNLKLPLLRYFRMDAGSHLGSTQPVQAIFELIKSRLASGNIESKRLTSQPDYQ